MLGSATAPKAVKRPRSPTRPPREEWDVENSPGALTEEFLDCIAVTVDADVYVQTDLDDANREIIEAIPGRYWKLGVSRHGTPVYRQEYGTAPNDKELFLLYSPAVRYRGWYIADKYYDDAPDRKIFAWADTLHSAVHVPYWSSEPLVGAALRSQHEYAEHMYVGLQADLDKAVHDLASLPASAAAPSTGNIPNASGGGWFNRALPLVKAILDGDIDEATDLATKYSAIPLMQDGLNRLAAKAAKRSHG